MEFSTFGDKFARYSGITQLMDDLNDGLRNPDAIMLGGGNPAQIPEMLTYFNQLCQQMAASGELTQAMTNYDGPQGKNTFINALADLLRERFGWPITARNIALTNGSQSAFFNLFNLLAGTFSDGTRKKILLPLAPEYIGYGDAGLSEEMFISYRPEITLLEDGLFKYHVDFKNLVVDDSIGAICASRPTNPTGNVLTDEEIAHLDALAREHGIPLIIDNAYGMPFPDIIFEDVTPFWNDNTVLCMSLSKLGLPGVRCGIVVAREEIATAITNMNGVLSLAPGSVGPALAYRMIEQNDLLTLSETVIKPFYQRKSQHAVALLQQAITDPRFRIHKPEGAMFLWLWFNDLPISTMELYQRLKDRGVLIVPGEYFFIGLEEDWQHGHECLRMNYVQEDDVMQRGIAIIAEEVARAYREGKPAD
ncbi:valine--pyruvate transaminase [Photobacterium ganghwense]|uniref:Valine--pyruvate aminotransferase n=1 Tax=Photobacterium ganghwense TaxID=320778 RepID=A0A0J1GZH2_9GAMM|nr:valine--pyruvate transaminase [Photobacterium ganghwense]KLV05051.1 valine--pyruvate aminotransferase [Photobacterium ganghwense]MBV1840058.1 valine--pyruvate transaminase [Photobacterium ganghwense]PSU04357.1 valine--pyruvate transaminase [Photobacterium ganghwense]QSV14115.1 valine--pyruvate transaminase [Photobacterium ganghwense]